MRLMTQRIKEEPFGLSPSPSPAASPGLPQSSPLVVKVESSPVSAIRIDSSGRAVPVPVPVSLIKPSPNTAKTPTLVKIVRRGAPPGATSVSALSLAAAPRPAGSVQSAAAAAALAATKPIAVKAEPLRSRAFDPTALAMPIKVQPKPRLPHPGLKLEPAIAASSASASTSSASASASTSASASSSEVVREFDVRAPKLGRRRFSVLRFQGGMDFTKCASAVMQRQNNLREFKTANDITDVPKSGAGSEYRREQREEARRKKYGLKLREYNPHEQPWLLQFQPQADPKAEVKAEVKSEKGEKKVKKEKEEKKEEKDKDKDKDKDTGPKRYKGHREGSISDNVTYFVFTQCKDGAFEAFPIAAWYNMSPELRYRYLNTDEAEVEFARRGKIMNYMNLMVQRRLLDATDGDGEGGGGGGGDDGKDEKRGDGGVGGGGDGGGGEGKGKEALADVTRVAIARARRGETRKTKGGGGGGGGGKKRRSNLMLTEMDEWLDEEDDERDEDEEGGGGKGGGAEEDGDGEAGGKGRGARRGPGGRRLKVRRGAGRTKKHRGSDEGSEVEDDSEPDDREGEEVDYMTHSSSDEEKLSADEREEIYAEKGVEEEGGLKGLLTDASSEEEEEEKKEEEKETSGSAASRRKEEQKAAKPARAQRGSDNSSSSSSSSSDEEESDSELEKEAAKVRPILSRLTPLPAASGTAEALSSSSSTAAATATEAPEPSSSGRKREGAPVGADGDTGGHGEASSAAKRFKSAAASSGPSSSSGGGGGGGSDTGVTEEAIRRYLLRKPMTAKDLLLKFSRRLSLRKCEISKQIARLLQKMKVQKRNHNGITLLSLASQ